MCQALGLGALGVKGDAHRVPAPKAFRPMAEKWAAVGLRHSCSAGAS